MAYVAIAALLAAAFLLVRLLLLRRELRRASGQLEAFNLGHTEKKLDLAFYDGRLELLAEHVNRLIDHAKQAHADRRRSENELKRAVANISHDIRTPMTSILGYVQFLESEALAPERRAEYTATVKNGALRLKALLEDFFELSLIESPDYPLQAEPIRMNDLVLEVLAGFYEPFLQRRLEPAIAIAEEDLFVRADPSAVKRVIENLLLNAIKHASGDVSIRLAKTPAAVRLTIENRAERLSEKDIVYLFDRFYTADRTRGGSGTGIGLSIAKSLMAKMNGSLSAELVAGKLVMICEWQPEPPGEQDRHGQAGRGDELQ
ncbi:sensor histidine kinase [Paenibacillus glycinis]|uniref:histidine kinase n=1 Tax=Paenibacillus glycinis TaxID=2697035 RepID=A0ABW9XS67_9BACL|nr:HAMP domain-containing sensor histidine kinase [Paenibacillus glycinis]NBD25211.1 sensor histidine kinase [Paenibacillus glycinis]